MCGRISLKASPDEIAAFLRSLAASQPRDDWYESRYNIAPSQMLATIIQDENVRYTVPRKWGFVWKFASDPAKQYQLWAKAETVSTLKSFKEAFRQRRGLIVADAYIEWRVNPGAKAKTPIRVHQGGNAPFLIAAITESWGDPMAPLETCAVITRPASDAMRPVHHRMPVMLSSASVDEWFDPSTSIERADEIMKTSIPHLMYHPVSTYVNGPGNDGPRCWEPDETVVV